jgi:hypothetical protein
MSLLEQLDDELPKPKQPELKPSNNNGNGANRNKSGSKKEPPSAFERACKYVAKMPASVQGKDGSDDCMAAAVACVIGFELSDGEALRVLRDHHVAQPPWSEDELKHKIKSAHKQPTKDKPKPPKGYLLNVPAPTQSNGYDNVSADNTGNDPGEPPPGMFDDEPPESAEQKPAEPPPFALITLGSLVAPALERAERRRSGDEIPVPVPFPAYAAALGGGLWPGAHFVVSGTGVGKSQLTIQTAYHAATQGVPVLYIGLELDEAQIALRVLSESTGHRWSNLYLGRCSPADLDKARGAIPALEGLPFYVDFGNAHGWPASRLAAAVQAMRQRHPSGPLHVVLDYLQLVGDEPAAFERRPDTREKIGSAAYAARDVARRYDASVQVVSSAARTHYGLLASDAKEAGLASRRTPDGLATERVILHPHTLVGLGKESGEVEFSADTVSVLIRWPGQLESGETPVVLAVPKVRYGLPRWCALRFWSRFDELPIQSTEELPEVAKRGGKGKPVEGDEYKQRIIETVRRKPGMKSQNDVTTAAGGNKQKLGQAFKSLTEAGVIVTGSAGFEIREAGNQ